MPELKCDGCERNIADPITVPYIVHEAAMERNDRVFRRMWACIILLIVLLVGSNAGWLIYESQFIEESIVEVEQTNDTGNNSFIGNDGDIVYGNAED